MSTNPTITASPDVEQLKSNLTTIQQGIATIEHDITMMEREIAMIEQEKSELWNDFFEVSQELCPMKQRMQKKEEDIAEARRCLDVLNNPHAVRSKLQKNWTVKSRIMIGDSPETKRQKINDYLYNQQLFHGYDEHDINVKENLCREIEDLLKDKKQLGNEKRQSLMDKKTLVKEKHELLWKLRAQLLRLVLPNHASHAIYAGLTTAYESGLVYVQESHRIGLVAAANSINIGLVDSGEVRSDIPTLEPCKDLGNVWFLTGSSMSTTHYSCPWDNRFQDLDSRTLKLALKAFLFDSELGHVTTMSAFSILFLAAAGDSGWVQSTFKTHQEVLSSLFVLCKAKEDDTSFQPQKIACDLDAAGTLGDGVDAYGLMVITGKTKEQCDPQALLQDYTKCALMATAAAMTVRQFIAKEHFQEIAIPFVVGTEDCCSLFVATLNNEGTPVIQVVGYPDGSRSKDRDLSTLCSKERTKLFLALAFYLDKFRKLAKKHGTKLYDRVLCQDVQTVKYLPTCFPGGSDNDKGIPGFALLHPKSNEYYAREAAACGGRFNIYRDFDRKLQFKTDGGIEWNEQIESPFYFNGSIGSSQVLLKVWKADDIDEATVESEWMCHRIAKDAFVNVQSLMLPDVARVTSSCGSEYLVIALSTGGSYGIKCETIDNLVQFCRYLIEAVVKLHGADILHCNLMPSNLSWNNYSVTLFDFGKAQRISKAVWVQGTEGFQAPEILQGMPCSVKSDSFAVGQIILPMVEKFEGQDRNDYSDYRCRLLREIGVNLTAADPEERWFLWQAQQKMRETL